MLPDNCEFVVNFAPDLVEIIAEAKYLEKLGYPIPELAHSVTLQEDKYFTYQETLHECLQRYHTILGQLNSAEVGLNGLYLTFSCSYPPLLFSSYRLSCSICRYRPFNEFSSQA